ncbi:MAG: DUF362 domain-containing protein [Thermodesulfobacteriota bacterium]
MHHPNHGSPLFCMDRRRFLKTAGMAGAGLIAFGHHGCAGGKARKQPAPLPVLTNLPGRVTIRAVPPNASDGDIIRAVQRTAEAATDFSWLSRGDVVFIKPVANSPNPYPAVTSPLAVRAMTGLLLRKGAGKVIVGDKPGVITVHHEPEERSGSSRDVLTRVGLHVAAIESGAEMHYFDEYGYDAYSGYRTSSPGNWKNELMLPDILNHVDHIVLLPRVSRHVLAGTTLGLKAAVGWLRDDSRLEFHRDADTFFEKIAEINDAPVLRQKLRLTLSVATKVLSTYGPDKGYVATPKTGLVFASDSLLAHDMAALGWLLWNREFETPPGELSWFNDPYTGIPSSLNSGFVGYIWGIRQWYHASHYDPVPITSAAADPVIGRAARLWGGFPRLEMEDVGGDLPAAIHDYLMEKAKAG